jgi:3-oxoacyl-[acyl-carrier protein] reductase
MRHNRVVVVTGGGRGIGRAICQRFAADGAQTVAAARSLPELSHTRLSIEKQGGRCHVHATDVCVPDEIAALVDATVERFQRLDVMVNCAGVAPQSGIEDLTPELFRTILAVNVEAVYHGCRSAWAPMKKQGGGTIVNISSVASVDSFPGLGAYGASKAWVNAWTKALADEGRPLGIQVFAVAPGAVETKMLRDLLPDFPADSTLRPADVADVVFAIAQPAFRYATGQTVFVRKQGD